MRLRAYARLARIALALLACLPGHYLALALTGRSDWPRRFLRMAVRATGTRLSIFGKPLDRNALIVANHRSWLDILVIAAASGCTFVSKAEVRRWPLVGWLAGLNDTIFIERGRRGDVRAQVDALRNALVRTKPVALFPEGTTNETPGILPFRPSLFAAVDPPPPGVRVQPALIDYGADEPFVTWPEPESAWDNVVRILGRRGPLAVTVHFVSPIDPAALPGRKAIAAAAQAALEAAASIR